ncbi:MAG: LptE family protein [Chlorobi bacterium]|nr:LptE family protein [Chlorobiota bacterium]
MESTNKIKSLIVGSLLMAMLSACSYSFSGASVPKHLHTISIPLFKDNSGSAEPNLNSTFTYATIQKFIDDANLQVSDGKNTDAVLECTITRFSDNPQSISGEETISVRRVTLTVKAVYRDIVERKTVFTKDFSNYGEYENSGDILAKRKVAIQEAIDKISEDILLKVVADW